MRYFKEITHYCTLILIGMPLLVFGQVTTNLSQDQLAEAETLYQASCAGCHGVKMEAFTSWEWKYGESEQEIYASIAEGRGKGAMPAFGEALSEDQIKLLVDYLEYGLATYEQYGYADDYDPPSTFEALGLKVNAELMFEGLGSPWGMAFLNEEELLVTIKEGSVLKLNLDGTKTKIKGVPEVNDEGQGGMLDIRLHPEFEQNQLLYLSYSKTKKEKGNRVNTTAVSRYRLEGNELQDEKLIFEGMPYYETEHHYGSRMEFDNEGYLYITIGDRGRREINPQRLDLYPGKVHRLYDDGSIPEDNPFVDQPDAIKSIYSFGHRNPQGLSKHPETGQLWAHEHGPRGGDELNIIQRGANYGWPVISYGINYDGTTFTAKTEQAGMLNPVTYWVPSIAPCGMSFVNSDRYPQWKGHLLVGSLRFEYVNLCELNGDEVASESKLMTGIGRVRSIVESPDGFIYVGLEEPGRIYRLVPMEN